MTTPLRFLLPVPLLAVWGCLDPGAPGNLVPRTVDEDRALPAIEITTARLHAEAFGPADAPILMVLHGGPGGDYRGLLPLRALADDGYRVVFWDQRGAGLSQRVAPEAITFDSYLDDLRAVIAHYTTHAGQPLVFIGHSWGAMYATWYIDTFGDDGGRIRGAVLSEPGGFTKRQLDDFTRRQGKSIGVFTEDLGDIAWQETFLTPAPEDQVRADYLMALSASIGMPSEHRDPAKPRPFWRQGAIVFQRLFALAKEGFDWTQHLGAFTAPVVFLNGDLNEAATLAHQQELAASYPNASIVTLGGVGHQMIWERPDDYLGAVRAYLARLAVGGAR